MLTRELFENPGERRGRPDRRSGRPHYFQANIGKVKTVNDLLNNSELYNYVMTAFGLSDMTYAKGLIRKVLEGGVSSSKASPIR